MDQYLLTVVIAAKDPPSALLTLCIAGFSALAHSHRIQLILIESGEPVELQPSAFARFADTQRLQVPPEGVYAAYNAGICAAKGRYLLFFGVDDIALPGMDSVIAHLDAAAEPYYLYAATCYMQARGIHRPSKRRTSLIFANWCHQGIFYLRTHLVNHPYEPRYRMQADHKLNIDIVSNPTLRFGVSDELVAYFSAGGISTQKPDLVFRNDFPAIVSSAYGRTFGIFVKVKQVLIDRLLGDPERRFQARLPR